MQATSGLTNKTGGFSAWGELFHRFGSYKYVHTLHIVLSFLTHYFGKLPMPLIQKRKGLPTRLQIRRSAIYRSLTEVTLEVMLSITWKLSLPCPGNLLSC